MLKKYDMKIEENDIKQVVIEMGDKVLGKTLKYVPVSTITIACKILCGIAYFFS